MEELEKNRLRKKAESILSGQKMPSHNSKIDEADFIKVLHELEVCQIELELQDEELKKTTDEKERITKEYNELTDLHTRFILHIIKKGKLN